MPNLFNHQKRIIEEDPKKALIAWGTGSGKSFTALSLAKGKTLVICPKILRDTKTWEREKEKHNLDIELTVLSKEDLKSKWESLPKFQSVIIDEIHTICSGVYPDTRQRNKVSIPKMSQLYESTYAYLKKHPPERLYLLSATPVSVSKPMNLWAVMTLLGENWNYFAFREKYYTSIRMGNRGIWIPKNSNELKDRMIEVIKRKAYTGSLNDWFDVPLQLEHEVFIPLTKEQSDAIKALHREEADVMVRRTKQRAIENGILYYQSVENIGGKVEKMVKKHHSYKNEKINYILEKAEEFKKILIFANYRAQIFEIEKDLKEVGYKPYILTGSTPLKDRQDMLVSAEKASNAIVIAQASLGAGWEFPSCPCVIFASKSYKSTDLIQSKGRVQRANNIKKNIYIHLLIPNSIDLECHKKVCSGEDFVERILDTDIIKD